MTNLIGHIREVARKHAAYARTRAELRAMPLDVAHDLDIDPMQADRIAARAVYGR